MNVKFQNIWPTYHYLESKGLLRISFHLDETSFMSYADLIL